MINRLSRAAYAKITALIMSFVLIFSPGLPFLPDSTASAEATAPPSNLKVDSFTHNTVTLSWDLADGNTSDDGYNVYGTDGKYYRWISGPPAEIGGLKAETEYSFYVTAGLTGLKSNVATVTTAPDPGGYPEPPLLPPTI